MKKIIGLFICVIAINYSYAQQAPQYSQYLRNQYMVNPGAAGVYDFTDVTVSARMQWLGFSNAPMTTYASATSQLSKKPKVRYNPSLRISTGPVKNPEIKTGKMVHAVGGQLIGDQWGAFRRVNFAGTYALHLPVATGCMLSFGTRVGISNNTFIQERAVAKNYTSDVTYTDYTANLANRNIVNLGVGLYFYSQRFFFGVSGDQLTKDMITFGSSSINFDTKIHANITGGCKFNISDSLTLTPAFLVKYMSPAPMSVEGSLQLEYREWLWCGASYRHKDAIVVMAGLNISRRFKFGYSFDYSINRFNNYCAGGHELVLGIMFR